MSSLSPQDLAQADRQAYFMVQGSGLRWGISALRIRRIAAAADDEAPSSLSLPREFLPFEDGAVGCWTLVIETRHGLRSLSVSRFLELVPTEQINLQPLPALCCGPREAGALARISHVALAKNSDELLFLIVDPMG